MGLDMGRRQGLRARPGSPTGGQTALGWGACKPRYGPCPFSTSTKATLLQTHGLLSPF